VVVLAAAMAGIPCAVAPLPIEGHLPPDCWASSQSDCLGRPGCRWFSYHAEGGCDFCEEWFGDQANITGCHPWPAADYCEHTIFRSAQSKYGDNPANDVFREVVRHYHVTQGSGELGNPHLKEVVCSVWCDFSPPFECFGQPRTLHELKGVNYGGRFIPESYLRTPGSEDLFSGIAPPAQARSVSLCDLGSVPDAAARMAAFLDLNIRQEHFDAMAKRKFNMVRLPLGYWNLIDVPGNAAPNSFDANRWHNLQAIMPAAKYADWIENAFSFAEKAGLRVLLDLHGAPGGQSGNAFTGCDQGAGQAFFDTAWNRALAVQAIEAMAMICARHSASCFGIELLNEPAGSTGPGLEPEKEISRLTLQSFYRDAIEVARRHVHWDVPLVIMDWPGWLPWWKDQEVFSYAAHGRIVFSTHTYYLDAFMTGQEETRQYFASGDIAKIADFYLHSRYDIMVSEYALNNHGSGSALDDAFNYNSLENWFVNQFNQYGMGSMLWNFDAGEMMEAWGPVTVERLGASPIDWKKIFTGTPLWNRVRVSSDPIIS